jgi:uncharacterized protein YeaC (DUF1315 family)
MIFSMHALIYTRMLATVVELNKQPTHPAVSEDQAADCKHTVV